MADQDTGKDSTLNDNTANMSKIGASMMGTSKRYVSKDKYIEPKFNVPGYVDGTTKPYRGRNMESFCRQSPG